MLVAGHLQAQGEDPVAAEPVGHVAERMSSSDSRICGCASSSAPTMLWPDRAWPRKVTNVARAAEIRRLAPPVERRHRSARRCGAASAAAVPDPAGWRLAERQLSHDGSPAAGRARSSRPRPRPTMRGRMCRPVTVPRMRLTRRGTAPRASNPAARPPQSSAELGAPAPHVRAEDATRMAPPGRRSRSCSPRPAPPCFGPQRPQRLDPDRRSASAKSSRRLGRIDEVEARVDRLAQLSKGRVVAPQEGREAAAAMPESANALWSRTRLRSGLCFGRRSGSV